MQTPKKLITPGLLFYIGAFYGTIQLYFNDRMRVNLDQLRESGEWKQERLDIQHINYKKKKEAWDREEARNQYNRYRRVVVSYAKGSVLELGCGSGRNFPFYKEDAIVIATDISDKMIAESMDKLSKRDLSDIKANIELQKENAECLSFADNSFDFVVDTFNYQVYEERNKVMSEINRVLRPGGYFIFIAKGASFYSLVNHYFVAFKPFYLMTQGADFTIEVDKELLPNFEIIYQNRRNYGMTYIYVLQKKQNV